MQTVNLSYLSLSVVLLLLAIPVFLDRHYQLKLLKPLFISVLRMSIQLILIGIFLKYLFVWNNTLLNILWLALMILIAVYTSVRNASMKVSKILLPTYAAFAIATLTIILFLNIFVIRLHNIFDARYLILLGGMLLGNALRGNVIGITTFYKSIQKESKQYLYSLALGASFSEAVLPYMKESLKLALKPTIASMAAMGVVSIPGMMTGVILGGTSPDTAVKYQIMIVIAIVVSTILSVFLTVWLTQKNCFDRYGILKTDIFLK